MPFTADQIADRNVGDAGTDLDHIAGELMAHRHGWLQRLLRPLVPRLDMQVGATDSCSPDLNQYVARPNRGHRNIDQLQPRPWFWLHEGFHQLPPTSPHCHTAPRHRVAAPRDEDTAADGASS